MGNKKKAEKEAEKKKEEALAVVCVPITGTRPALCLLLSTLRPKYPSELFFKHNTALGPPFRVLIDTNFINFSIKNKLDIVRAMMDCLLAKCTCKGVWRRRLSWRHLVSAWHQAYPA